MNISMLLTRGIEELFGVDQIGGAVAFTEPTKHLLQLSAGFIAPILLLAKAKQADHGAQFPGLGVL